MAKTRGGNGGVLGENVSFLRTGRWWTRTLTKNNQHNGKSADITFKGIVTMVLSNLRNVRNRMIKLKYRFASHIKGSKTKRFREMEQKTETQDSSSPRMSKQIKFHIAGAT